MRRESIRRSQQQVRVLLGYDLSLTPQVLDGTRISLHVRVLTAVTLVEADGADLGPYPTIASLSLGTPRNFRLRQTDPVDPAYSSGKPIRTYEVILGHNSLVLMNAGCQERYKHT
jgi:hypothetical protein